MTDLPDGLRALSPALAARAQTMAAGMAGEPIVGEWDDAEWRQVAAKRGRSAAEQKVVAAGPREHPFGPEAVTVREKNQPVRIFASKAAHEAWVVANPPKPDVPAPPRPVATAAPVVVGPTMAAQTS